MVILLGNRGWNTQLNDTRSSFAPQIQLSSDSLRSFLDTRKPNVRIACLCPLHHRATQAKLVSIVSNLDCWHPLAYIPCAVLNLHSHRTLLQRGVCCKNGWRRKTSGALVVKQPTCAASVLAHASPVP